MSRPSFVPAIEHVTGLPPRDADSDDDIDTVREDDNVITVFSPVAAPSHAAGNPFGPLLPIQELLEALPPADREDKPAEPVIEDYASYASDDSAWELKEEEVNSPKRISVSTNVTRPITPVAFSASPKIIQQVASNILFDVINDVDRVVSPPMSPEVSMLTYSVDSVGAPSTSPLPPSDLAVVDVSTMSDVTSTNVMDVVDANPVAVTVDAPLILPRSRSPHITASTPQAVVDIEQQYESGSENNKPVLTIRPSLQLSVGEGSVTVAELLKPRYSLSVSKPVVIDLGLERQPLLMSSPQAAAALSGRLPHPKQQSLDVTVRSDGVTIEPDDNTNECSQLHDTPFIEHRPGSAYSVQRGASRRQSRRVKVCDMGMQTTSDEPLFTTVTSKPDTDRSVPEPMLFRQPSKIPTPSFRSIPPRALLPQQDMGISERSLSLPPLAPAVPRRMHRSSAPSPIELTVLSRISGGTGTPSRRSSDGVSSKMSRSHLSAASPAPSLLNSKFLTSPRSPQESDPEALTSSVQTVLSRYQGCLHTVFQHYSQFKHESAGRLNTFDAIVKNAALINKSAFMKCCKDFCIQGDLLTKSAIEKCFNEAVSITHSKQLGESEFGHCLARCILEGMSHHVGLNARYPNPTEKLVAVFSKMGFNNRRELRAVMLARGFGQTVTQSLAAILLMESKPTAPPVAGVPSVGLKNGDKIPVATRIPFKRRASMEARMRLVTTPGNDLVEEVMMPLEM